MRAAAAQAGVAPPVTPDDVLRASRAIGNRLHRTPLLSSATLGEAVGARVFLKAELFQRTGSFKPRGMLTRLASLSADERRAGVVTVSAGNAAAALAYGAALEAIDCLVVMAAAASPLKVAATRAYGASVDLEARTAEEAFARANELREASGRTFVHPFDDDAVIAGHGSLGLEIVEDRPDVDVVVVPVGGGGLVSGVAVAVTGARPDARVVAVEPERSAALQAALAAGRPVRVAPASIADGLNAPFAGERCLAVCRTLLAASVTVSEAEIREGFRFLYARSKLAAEPAGVAGVAALLAGKVYDVRGKTVVVVVSGGNVAAETASGILGSDEG
ncbi:MAG: pyridoxal-phosphate dependent enzyme [Actinomycetota bacterium]|nr:pyridoxal-phosphate dependent enzyme [Actinomycetota bacterium]